MDCSTCQGRVYSSGSSWPSVARFLVTQTSTVERPFSCRRCFMTSLYIIHCTGLDARIVSLWCNLWRWNWHTVVHHCYLLNYCFTLSSCCWWISITIFARPYPMWTSCTLETLHILALNRCLCVCPYNQLANISLQGGPKTDFFLLLVTSFFSCLYFPFLGLFTLSLTFIIGSLRFQVGCRKSRLNLDYNLWQVGCWTLTHSIFARPRPQVSSDMQSSGL